MRASAFLLLLLLPGLALADGTSIKHQDPCHDTLFARGRFNSSIGFSAAAPTGYEAGRDGFRCTAYSVGGIHLGCGCSGDDHWRYIALNDEREQICIGGEKCRRFGGKPKPLAWYVDLEISTYRDDAKHGTLHILKRNETRLDTLPAQRVVMQYTTANGRKMIADVTVALRAAHDNVADYQYIVALETRVEDHPAHRKRLEAVLRSWKRVAIQQD